MEGSLYRASLSGNVAALDALLQEDELILDRASLTSFHETPLHIAIMRGHLHFATSLLHRQPKLSNDFDALHRLPIHLAAMGDHAELVRRLLEISPNSFSVRDEDGKTPLHLAAMKGRVNVIEELVRSCPESIQQRLHRGETTLHLCARYNQLEALKLLVEASNDEAFLNVQDDNGNTILHLATFLKQLETVRYLVSIPIIAANVNALNVMGFTALDLLEHLPRNFKSLEIGDILAKVGRNRSVEHPNITTLRIQSPLQPNVGGITEAKPVKSSWCAQLSSICEKHMIHQRNWVEEMQGSLMLVATLTATISFQVAFSPPGGLWGSTKANITDCAVANGTCKAGTAVLAYVYPEYYLPLIVFATISFIASMSIVLLTISGLPLKNKFSTWLMTVAMVVAITFTALTYLYSMMLTIPDHMLSQANRTYKDTFYIWLALLGVIAVSTTMRLLLWLKQISPKVMPFSCVMLTTSANKNSPISI